MKNYMQNVNKSKKIDFQNKKKNIISSDNDNKKKLNQSPSKQEIKKDLFKNEKNIPPFNLQPSESKENNLKITNNNNNTKTIFNNQNNINLNSKKNEKNKEIKNIDSNSIQIKKSSNNIENHNIIENKENNNKIEKEPQTINIFINEHNKDIKNDNSNNSNKNSSPFKNNINHISYCDNKNNQINDNDQKLKSSLQAYKNINKKNDSTSLNTLYQLRSILLNLLKDKEQNLEYSKFMTEKKLKFLMKNKEKSETRIKELETELKSVEIRKEELEKNLGEIYCFYDEEELKEDIKRFENSNEVKSGKFSKTLEQLETMKKMLPLVSEYGKIKDKNNKIINEKKELIKIIKNSSQTIATLNNYYKNIKKKINEQFNIN